LTLGIGAAGISAYTNGVNVSNAPYGTLKGLPRQPIEFAKTVGTQGDITLANMKQMLTISRGGMAQAVSMHVEFLTDQMALRFIMRVGGQPWEIAPITPYNGTNTQSNFVTIATRS
jgi:HK97 family phage major capsid protein